MVMELEQLELFVADDEEVNDLTLGKAAGKSYPWPTMGAAVRIPRGHVGVLCRQDIVRPGHIKPVALVLHPEDERRLFGRFSQLRGDLSPLSSWLHIFTPQHFERLTGASHQATLDGMEASWAGLIVAETALLSGRPPSQLKLTACLATPSFAVARATALGVAKATSSILQSHEELQKTLRSDRTSYGRLRQSFEPVWHILQAVSGMPATLNKEQEALVGALLALRRARDTGQNDLEAVQEGLWLLPEARALSSFEEASPESRLKEFDKVLSAMRQARDEPGRRLHLAFLAAYMATIVAGGASSLTIAEAAADDAPEVLAFAYIISGIGEYRSWSGAFDGLGRLVTRELLRDLDVADGPSCDFASSEASALIDRALSDPLVYLRLKQSRVATVALLPGLNIQVPFAEMPDTRQSKASTSGTRPTGATRDPLRILADALLPYLAEAMANGQNRQDPDASSQSTRRGGTRRYPR